MRRPLLLTLVLALTAAAPALKGPPWISIESPANPLDPETRGAAFVVRVYHHATPTSYSVAGTAEGLVNGERRSVKLVLERTSKPGVYTMKRQWPTEGVWTVLVSVLGENERKAATAIVELSPEGQVASVRVPARTDGRWTIPVGEVSMVEIDASLRARTVRLARGG